MDLLKSLDETVAFLTENGFDSPSVGIVLGSGLGKFVSKMEIEKAISYKDIPHFPVSTVEFHKGQLLFGRVGGKRVIAMQGRFHYYEGYSLQEVTFPVRVMQKLGVSDLLLSNAAGGINKNFDKGDLVLLEDHINLQPENPLRGLNDPAFGNRFVDMFEPYDAGLKKLFETAALKMDIKLKSGVYAAVSGPNLETRAEYRYLAQIGGDLVGMSTVPEVIVANHVGLKCAAVSVVTDECSPGKLGPVDITEILRVAAEADEKLSGLFEAVIHQM